MNTTGPTFLLIGGQAWMRSGKRTSFINHQEKKEKAA